jgi:hypothetical protein
MRVTRKLSRAVVGLALVVAGAAACDAPPQQAATADTGQALQDFQARVEQYEKLRERAGKDVPDLEETSDPAKIAGAQAALAEQIRAARSDAKSGDIFTPPVRDRFRQLMYPEVRGQDSKDTRDAIKEDAPAPGEVPLKVNAKYPADAPLPTVPPNLLASLPSLPEDLEYRIVGKHLILLDVRANLIVDFIPNVIR